MLRFAMAGHRRVEERPWVDEVHDLARRSLENPMVRVILDSIEGLVMILDQDRRVLASNPELLAALGLQESESLIGKRPGEAMGCIHADETELGCGGAAACTQCGALLAIVTSQEQNGPAPVECCLSLRREGRLEACEFQVRATPLVLGAHRLTVLVLQDISARKRREVLESLMFHQVQEAVEGIGAWSEALGEAPDPRQAARRILALSLRLNEQMAWKRRLFQVEAGNLGLKVDSFPLRGCLERLRRRFDGAELAESRSLVLQKVPEGVSLRTDEDVLLQILSDMVANALEATPPGGTVRVAWEAKGESGRFLVHNDGAMAEEVALRVFQRSFSTREGPGRGLGTYAMKLLGENLLGGRVSFTSQAGEGTRFCFELPEGVEA